MSRALIVDDRQENRYLLRILLQAHGFEVTEASQGAEALATAVHELPDLVVSDLLMPIMDGYALLRRFRADERLRGVPFIVYTSTYRDEQDRKLALDLGADAFILKPVEPEELMRRIRTALGGGLHRPGPTGDSLPAEERQMQLYNQALVRKLEQRSARLEETVHELELRESQLLNSERRLRQVFDRLGPQIFVGLTRPDGTLVEVNLPALRVAGLAAREVVGKPLESTFWFSHSVELQRQIRTAIDRAVHGDNSRFDMEIRIGPDAYRTVDFSLQPLRGDDGQIQFLIPSASDITERKQAELGLRTALAGFQKVFQGAPEPMSISDLTNGEFIQVNDAFCSLFGHSREEVIGRTSVELNLWSDYSRRNLVVERVYTGIAVHRMAGKARTSSGAIRDILLSADAIEFEGRSCLLLMLVDITEQRRAEAGLEEARARLQQLSQRLLEIQETERAAIARELHDEIGQSLTAIKLSAQRLARRWKGPEAIRVEDCVALADGALRQVRSLALDLRPPQLDQLGLTAALRDLTVRVGDAAGIQVEFVADPADVARDYAQATAAFRVTQEALTNVVRHAGAGKVTVELRRAGGELIVSIADDGCSFDVDATRSRAVRGASIGLLGMEERVALAGGRLRIDSHPGRGTRVEAAFPVDAVAGRPP
jgi:PAS domain S-box-containing protein